MSTLNDEIKEKCNTSLGLFEVFSEQFKSKLSETILSLQYCKLIRQQSENAEEWMNCLTSKASECKDKEKED